MSKPTLWERTLQVMSRPLTVAVPPTSPPTTVRDEYGRESVLARAEVAGKKPDERPVMASGLDATRWEVFTDILSTEWVARALRLAEMGDMAAQMTLFEQMEERDPSLSAAMTTRRAAVTGIERAFLPAPTQNATDEKKAKQIMEDVREVVANIYDFDTAILDLQDAVGKGTSVLEIDWLNDGSVGSIRHINAKLQQYDHTSGDLYLWDTSRPFDQQRVYIKDYPFKFMVHRSKLRSGHASRGGVLRTVTWCYVFRNYAWKDQSVYCEIFGMPMRIGKYKPTATPTDKNQLASMLKQMASSAWAVISESTTIEFNEAVNRGQEPFTAFLNALRSEYFLAILGQEGTNVTNKYGSKGDTQIKQLVRQDILEADCRQTENTLRWQLFFPIVMYRWGLEAAKKFTPILHFRAEPPLNLTQEAETDSKVLVDMGLGRYVSAAALANKYGWQMVDPKTPDEERVLPKDFQPGKPTTQPDAPGPGPNSNKGTSGPSGKPDNAKKQGDNAKRGAKMMAGLAMLLAAKKAKAGSAEAEQQVLDQFIEEVSKSESDTAMQGILVPLLSAASECNSYEEFRTQLESIYGDLDMDKLQTVLGYGMMMARLFGRAAINKQIAE